MSDAARAGTQSAGQVGAPTSVGIDVAETRKGLDLVALDSQRLIVASYGRLSVDDVVQAVLALRPTVICIDSPSGWSRSGRSRLAERQLAQLGIQSYRTGTDPGDHPFYGWIRVGLQIFDRLSETYPLYRGDELAGHAAEIFPHASAALLTGHLPPPRGKEVFRRSALSSCGVAEDRLPTIDRVDAAVAALTGLLGLEGCRADVGDPGEGIILLPVRTLPATPLRRSNGSKSRSDGTPALTASVVSRRTRSPPQRGARPQGATVQLGYVNRNDQTVIRATGLPGTDHGQSIYVLRCGNCGHEYGSNGSDNFQRKCPACQRGTPGLPYR